MQWLNEPSNWKIKDRIIEVTSTQNTDFWRKTHYGFIRDTGHFYYQQLTGNFIAEVKVSGKYQDLYDQAGLMVRLDENNWLKCGIELVERIQQMSAVVTRDYSDWSIVPMPHNPASIWLRVTRRDSAIEIYYSLDGQQYTLLRMAYLTLAATVDVGIMCASPEGKGFTTVFEQFKIHRVAKLESA
jgi:regulation of enolase protein 1 (concanavalin A-like superfamily)